MDSCHQLPNYAPNEIQNPASPRWPKKPATFLGSLGERVLKSKRWIMHPRLIRHTSEIKCFSRQTSRHSLLDADSEGHPVIETITKQFICNLVSVNNLFFSNHSDELVLKYNKCFFHGIIAQWKNVIIQNSLSVWCKNPHLDTLSRSQAIPLLQRLCKMKVVLPAFFLLTVSPFA